MTKQEQVIKEILPNGVQSKTDGRLINGLAPDTTPVNCIILSTAQDVKENKRWYLVEANGYLINLFIAQTTNDAGSARATLQDLVALGSSIANTIKQNVLLKYQALSAPVNNESHIKNKIFKDLFDLNIESTEAKISTPAISLDSDDMSLGM